MTDHNLPEPEKTRIIACGAIAREVLAVLSSSKLNHIDTKCLPAIWHNSPDKIAPGVDQAIIEAKSEGYKHIFVAYADCGTGGRLDKICEKHQVKRIKGPHCYSFFNGNDDFEKRWPDDMVSFFLTDFLVRQFDSFVVRPLGLDRHPELRDIYFGNYKKLIYLAQEENDELQEKALEAANFLGLAYEYRKTGYGDLTPAINSALQPNYP